MEELHQMLQNERSAKQKLVAQICNTMEGLQAQLKEAEAVNKAAAVVSTVAQRNAEVMQQEQL